MSERKKIEALSDRLAAIAAEVTSGKKVIDIGTDHAYIPIALVGCHAAPAAIAADIRRGPLATAAANILKSGLSAHIKTVLSDGFQNVEVEGGEAAVIAGMGGATMMGIISAAGQKVMKLSELILEPQSRVPDVRKYLCRSGFSFLDEAMVSEEGKFYPILKVVYTGEKRLLTEAQALYGPVLLEKRDPVLLRYLEKETEGLATIENGIEDAANLLGMNEAREAALVGVAGMARIIRDALAYYL